MIHFAIVMGVIAAGSIIAFLGWLDERTSGKGEVTPLREYKEAKQLGGAMKGIGQALPFFGTQSLHMPPPPPPVEFEPDYGPNQIHLDDQGTERQSFAAPASALPLQPLPFD